ncbi:hypothetical protein CBR_g3432 [Chara braunii]|uniref:Integrase catalytic domain-containing protein n=1 Tax=Chara braunii TaxID=69332 RepID=A0A388JQZ6_CHABU|nr:hypothetical protein CBR_g3432 [Chara braunii]|eukprot:GBG60188.1 hypothetical protein CBR_g3432 [Chara braunii]
MMVDSQGNQTEIDDVSKLVESSELDGEDSVEGSNLTAEVKTNAGDRDKAVNRDALSRRADYLGALSLSEDVTRSLGKAYKEDPITMDIINKQEAKDKATTDEFVMVDGLLFLEKAGFKRLVVPSREIWRSLFLGDCHDATGHFGYKKTNANLVQRFRWPNMLDDAKKYVQTCQVCQRNKPRTQAPLGLLKPLPIPAGPGQSISMDFMDTLVTSMNGKRHIFVIVDRFTKFARLIAVSETATTEHVIKLFMDNWVRDFGLPKTTVSDRDVHFTSEMLKKDAEHMGSQLQTSSGNYPEGNGQAEEMNRVVQHLLKHYIKPSQDDWDEKLPLIASLYNNVVHSTTGVTPNQLHLGWKPRSAPDFLLPENQPAATPGTIEFGVQYEKLLQQAVENIKKSQEAMIAYENKLVSTFQVEERVWVKASELGQEFGISRKLMTQYFGPWELLDIVGSEMDGPSYVNRIPGHLHTYPVFHASKLAPFAEIEQFPSRGFMLPPTMDGHVDVNDILEHRDMPVPKPFNCSSGLIYPLTSANQEKIWFRMVRKVTLWAIWKERRSRTLDCTKNPREKVWAATKEMIEAEILCHCRKVKLWVQNSPETEQVTLAKFKRVWLVGDMKWLNGHVLRWKEWHNSVKSVGQQNTQTVHSAVAYEPRGEHQRGRPRTLRSARGPVAHVSSGPGGDRHLFRQQRERQQAQRRARAAEASRTLISEAGATAAMATTAMSTSAQQTSQASSSSVVGSTVAQTVSQSSGLMASQAAVLTLEDVAIQQAALQEAQLHRALGEIKAEKEKMIRRRARMQRREADIEELEMMDLTHMDDDVRVVRKALLGVIEMQEHQTTILQDIQQSLAVLSGRAQATPSPAGPGAWPVPYPPFSVPPVTGVSPYIAPSTVAIVSIGMPLSGGVTAGSSLQVPVQIVFTPSPSQVAVTTQPAVSQPVQPQGTQPQQLAQQPVSPGPQPGMMQGPGQTQRVPKTTIAAPKTFTGDKRGEDLDTWLRAVPVYVRCKLTLPHEEVLVAASYLEGSAARWLSGLVQLQGYGHDFRAWAASQKLEDFLKMVEERWHDPQEAQRATDAILTLHTRQFKSVREATDAVEPLICVPGVHYDPQALLTSYLRCFFQPLRNQLAKEANINMHNFPSFSKVALDLEAKIGHGQAPTTEGRTKILPPNWKAKGHLMFVGNDGSTIELDGNLQEGVGLPVSCGRPLLQSRAPSCK